MGANNHIIYTANTISLSVFWTRLPFLHSIDDWAVRYEFAKQQNLTLLNFAVLCALGTCATFTHAQFAFVSIERNNCLPE